MKPNRQQTERAIERLEHVASLPSDSPGVALNYANMAGSSMALMVGGEPVAVGWPARYLGSRWPSLEGFQAWCQEQATALRMDLEHGEEAEQLYREDIVRDAMEAQHEPCGSPVCGYCGDHDYERMVGK